MRASAALKMTCARSCWRYVCAGEHFDTDTIRPRLRAAPSAQKFFDPERDLGAGARFRALHGLWIASILCCGCSLRGRGPRQLQALAI